jgi:hypothetical protein
MKMVFSVLYEISKKNEPSGEDYKMKDGEFRQVIIFLINENFIKVLIQTFEKHQLKSAKLTDKAITFLNEHPEFKENYPSKDELPNWVRDIEDYRAGMTQYDTEDDF